VANDSHGANAPETRMPRSASYTESVTKRSARPFLVLGLLLAAGCGGGASPHNVPNPAPTNASPQPQIVHRVIGFALGENPVLESVPAGDPAAVPPGGKDLGPVAQAAIVYPDGSVQYADPSGGYDPSQSSFARSYRTQLSSNALVQPTVILTDPTNAALASFANVSAYASAQQAQARVVRASRVLSGHQAVGTQMNVAGVVLLPETATLVSGNVLALNAVGVDTNNNVVDISNLSLKYSAQYGTVFAFPNSTQAYYMPPQVPATQLVDSVTVNVIGPDGVTTVASATNEITIVAQSQAASVSGTLADAGGSAIPGGVAVFAQAGLPQFFMPSYTLGTGNASGTYSTQLPANSLFSMGVGMGSAGNYGVYVGQTANGSSSYRSVAAGGTDTLNLSIASPPVPFSVLPLALQSNLPNWVTFVRDAWYAGFSFSRRIYSASSGIQQLLANAPQTLSAPTPSDPAPVGSGQFAKWCYQWQPISGVPTLVLIENTDSQCTQPGNEAYTVTVATPPAGGTASYQYVRYYSHTMFPITGTPDVVTGSLLVESGSWTQSVTTSGNAIQTDMATVSAQLYDELDQVIGQPVYNDAVAYQYSLDPNGLATEQFTNGQRTSAYDGSLVVSYSGTKTQLAPYASCAASASACNSVSATVSQDGYTYTVNGTHYGDGSRSLVYQSTSPGDDSKITLGIVSDAISNSTGCLTCASAPGTVYDTDGTTPIATFTVNNAGLVQVSIYNTPAGSSALGANVIDTLAFVL